MNIKMTDEVQKKICERYKSAIHIMEHGYDTEYAEGYAEALSNVLAWCNCRLVKDCKEDWRVEYLNDEITAKASLVTNVMLDEGAYMPEKAHASDAGFDLRSKEDVIVPAGGNATIDTGVHIEIPFGLAGVLISKSGLNVKHDITSTGLIDSGYTGSIRVKLYNHGEKDYHVSKGDKVSQIMLTPVYVTDLVLVDSFQDSERGDNGFGSSGK